MTNLMMPRFDYSSKTIVCRKDFLIAAAQFGTEEFRIYRELKEEYKDFTFIQFKAARNSEKRTYGKLTYEAMEDFIRGNFADATERKNALDEFALIKMVAKNQKKGSYARAKKWFLELYGEEYDRIQQERESANAEEQSA